MIPLAVPNLTGNERRYLGECIDSTFVSSVGPFVERLERDAAAATGATETVATSAGTTALHASLVVLGVRPGDLVIVPSFTFIASANAVRHAGADPWLMDVEPDSWCLNVEQVRRELETNCRILNGCAYHVATGRRVSAVMPVHTLGNTCDMDALRGLADAWGLAMLADAACAIGAKYHGRDLASLADLSAVSLNGNKTVTAGGGGLIVGLDEGLLGEARHLTTTARVWPGYDFDRVGYNYRMTNLQAAVAVAQLERLGEFVTRKRDVRKAYDEAFSDLHNVSPFPVPDWCESSCWLSGVVLDRAEGGVVECLRSRGVGAGAFWRPVHLQAPYASAPRASDLSVSEGLWKRVITLPCSTGITDVELSLVIAAFRDIAFAMERDEGGSSAT